MMQANIAKILLPYKKADIFMSGKECIYFPVHTCKRSTLQVEICWYTTNINFQ